MKKSKRWRKDVNQLRAISDVPWPPRRFRYPATTGRPLVTDRRCSSLVATRRRRRKGWRGLIDLLRFKRPVVESVICGAPLMLVPYDGRRRGHLACLRCGPLRVRQRRQGRRRR